jgi:hypothetical protein
VRGSVRKFRENRLAQCLAPHPPREERGDLSRKERGEVEVHQYDLAKQNATTCSSAVFIGEAGNSASASTAIAP